MKKIFSVFLALGVSALTCFAATVNVSPGSGTLKSAVGNAASGDVLVLSTGEYNESSNIQSAVPITIKAADGAKPVVKMTGCRFQPTADFTLQGINIQGTNEAVRLTPGASVYNITIKSCEFSGCPSYFIRVYTTDQASPYINKLMVDDCIFHMGTDAPNSARAIYSEASPKQLKNLEVKNSTFDGGSNGTGRFIYVYSGSDDLASLEGTVEIDHCTFYNSTNGRGVYPANIDKSHITNCIFMNTEERENTVSFAVYGENSYVRNCITFNAPVKIGTGGTQANNINRNPYFVDANNGNFQLYSNSSAINAGTDGTTIGDPRWGVSSQAHDNSDDPYAPYKMPYSMAPTTNSVKVLWQMNEETGPTEAVVYYGTDSTNLNQSITTDSGWNVADEGYVHVVTLTGLQPNTRYYFTVGASATRRCPKISWTKTAPEQGTAYRIFSISDIHGNSCNNWSNMQDFICNLNCDISLMNGDFVSSKGNDRNWNNYYFTPGQQFLGQVPCMSSPGNHETGDPRGLRWSSFYDYFHQFSHEGASEGDTIDPRGEAYFHFVYGNADVIVLNLNFDESSPAFVKNCRQYVWLDSVLNACSRPWIIVCHHVGIYTSGYHGQWSEEPKRAAPLLEKYAAQGKHIISLSGDDHSFEHLYKDGVHYVRPGCGRNSNYAQQKQIVDAKYSMFYKKVSCFSTLDMAADASKIALTAYDSVGNIFYTYDFLLDGEVITPSINFTSPATNVEVQDSIKLQWYAFDPNKDAVISLYYSQNPSATSVEGMTLIADNLPNTIDRYMWQTRSIEPKGTYYVYAAIRSAGQTFLSANPAVVTLVADVTPPPAPTTLRGFDQDGHYRLTWQNPTRPVHMETLLEDFSSGMASIQTEGEEGATMQASVVDGTLKCDYSITAAWTTASADYVFATPADLSKTPILSFRLKGNGTSTALRLVCKNMSSGHEDMWYTEKFTLSSSSWKTFELDMRTMSQFDWAPNTDQANHVEGVTRISFSISLGNSASGTFYIDDIKVSGDINPAPDFLQTVIVRKDSGFPQSVTDGTEIYRGADEQCVDQTANVGQMFYYAAFASDDRNNWSTPDADAQWYSGNLATSPTEVKSPAVPQTKLVNGMLLIEKEGKTYTALGAEVK
ncbi:MAG: metallophosphoesterase [Paludibacteraceae bacterium]|nr:metallophosphoesterase [Paludibacteraceae bacterium]